MRCFFFSWILCLLPLWLPMQSLLLYLWCSMNFFSDVLSSMKLPPMFHYIDWFSLNSLHFFLLFSHLRSLGLHFHATSPRKRKSVVFHFSIWMRLFSYKHFMCIWKCDNVRDDLLRAFLWYIPCAMGKEKGFWRFAMRMMLWQIAPTTTTAAAS